MEPTGADAGLEELLSARVMLVTGKGGTGKTTLAAALGRLAAARGKRVLLAEIGQEEVGAKTAVARSPLLEALGAPGAQSSGAPREIAANLWAVLLTPEAGHRAFLHDVLPFGFLIDRALRAEPLKRFLAAAPAFSELGVLYRGLQFVKAERGGAPEWDLVIIDAPASGHALAFATLPQMLLKVIPGGPIGRTAREGISILTDPRRTVAGIATLPGSLPVNDARADPCSAKEHEALAALLGKPHVLGSRTLQRLRRAQAGLRRLREAAARLRGGLAAE